MSTSTTTITAENLKTDDVLSGGWTVTFVGQPHQGFDQFRVTGRTASGRISTKNFRLGQRVKVERPR